MAAQAGRAVGTDGAGVVQIHQHRRVAHHREQHRAEAAGDMRADGFLHIGGGDRMGAALARADGKMVGPEPDQALAERRFGRQGVVHQRNAAGFGERWDAAIGLGGFLVAVEAQGGEAVGAAGHAGGAGIRAAELVQQPGWRVGRRRLGAARAEAEADQGIGGSDVHGGTLRREGFAQCDEG